MANLYNRFYTDEKWSKINSYNKSLFEDFLVELKSSGTPTSTYKQYRNDARIILIVIMEQFENKPIYELKKREFRKLIMHFSDLGMSPRRVNRLKSCASTLCTFAENSEDFEEMTDNYVTKVKSVKISDVREIVFLTDEEVETIYNTLLEEERYKEACLCAILYDSGARLNEIRQLKRDDIVEGVAITKREVTGKGGKKFRLSINRRTLESYKLYEKSRKDDNEALFINANLVPATEFNIYEWVKSWNEILEEELEVSKPNMNVHSFRHSTLENLENGSHYIARALGRKFTIQELQLLAHHSSSDVTMSYLRNKDEDKLLETFKLV